ncbi:helicase ARIP4 [Stomoxys calcitrans]|uniref:helicase ARIP4 n=1 Tax=Stomoxys calcitrans TaxID=35570 RepID=UPI0027E28789|nr:helicase ARIP4 [Stomoxys calcitrans]
MEKQEVLNYMESVNAGAAVVPPAPPQLMDAALQYGMYGMLGHPLAAGIGEMPAPVNVENSIQMQHQISLQEQQQQQSQHLQQQQQHIEQTQTQPLQHQPHLEQQQKEQELTSPPSQNQNQEQIAGPHDISSTAAVDSKESHDTPIAPSSNTTPSMDTLDSAESQKRKNSMQANDNSLLVKKQHLNQMAEEKEKEKKKSSLRKNIREVMDTNQLDTNTLKAQHEESERLARMAEQQKLLREYQQREAVLTHFDRFVNEHRVKDPADLLLDDKKKAASIKSSNHQDQTAGIKDDVELDDEDEAKKSPADSMVESNDSKSLEEKDTPPAEVVTIDDSSDDDDCIVLSDDEAEEEDDDNDDPHNSGMHVKDEFNVPDHLGRVVINVGHPDDEEDIFIAPQIARTIKPHQIGGVRFLFDNIIESPKRFNDSGGFGCILAHSMGLGKTLQVVCFCDIFLRYTPSKYVVCVMPINTLQNWNAEFDMWIPKYSDNPEYIRPREFDVFVLNDQQKTLTARARIILQWKEKGGVLLIGYELFRLLALKLSSAGKRRSKKQMNMDNNDSRSPLMDEVYEALVKPGPDLIICDEGHRIKNAQAGISQALKQIRTRRRIVLTGYPLQNNLLEYWCMVDFVRPNYLGTRTEFCNMFERPIQNGLCVDSTPDDIKLMRFRAHVLHSLLVGFVQRRSHTVLQQSLPEKQEYVILTRMSELQKQLYDTFMNDIVRTKNVPNPLKAFAVCCKIWNHPDVLYDAMKAAETGMDMDIEGVDEVDTLAPHPPHPKTTATANMHKNGFPPPVPGLPPPAVQQQSLLSTSSSLVENGSNGITVSNDNSNSNSMPKAQFLDQNEMPNPTQVTNEVAIAANKQNNFQSPSLFSDLNQYENSSMNSSGSGGYHQDLQPNYFSYPTMMHTMGSPLKPNYVGCMLKQTQGGAPGETTALEDSLNSSSEIVDLDTNEIKTIETDIDMDKNISLDRATSTTGVTGAGIESSTDTSSSMHNETETKSETGSVVSSSIATTESNDVDQKKGPEKITYDWATKFFKKYEPGLIVNSPKMEIFFCILNESVRIGDRVLLFSQSLLTLNVIEKFLQTTNMPGSTESCWLYNTHYFRLDGSTTSQEREKLVNEFNSNENVKLFLISTKAGSLGINLVGANRVIIFDASWNPCHDTQAIYRIYRYGQKRSCFVYRLVMDKCLEKKIYDRQIKKQGMSDRVVDECNPDAHLSIKDVTNLCYDYDDDDENKTTNSGDFSKPLESYTDTIMKIILTEYKTHLTKQPFFHESLLVDRKNDKLSQAEKRQAHRSYEMQKKTSSKTAIYSTTGRSPYQTVRPIQNRTTTTQKHSSGLRSTRWIPAEVWQKQGMTAQEMSLPLDVVIPTNSSNKSKIIIKAGQRVMVLKSAKGIYMQLDSGKIIAIRTLNKPNVPSTEKSDVIDITGESDSITSRDSKTEKSDSDTTTTSTIAPSPKDPSNAMETTTTKHPTNVVETRLESGASATASTSSSSSNSKQMDLFNSSTNTDTNLYKTKNSLEKDSKTLTRAADKPETTTTSFQQRLPLSQQQQPQQQSQTAQPQNPHIPHTQTLNEQHQLQNAHNQQPIATPHTNAPPLMHSQTPTTYTPHQPYNFYSQHQNPRSSQLYSSRGAEISASFHQPTTQFSDYPTYGSHQPHQSSRYHPSNSSHSDLAASSSSSHGHALAAHPHPHAQSISDFYYYPQWSSFMLASPSTNNESPHLMHNSNAAAAAATYPPIPPPTHAHSHHAKVQPNTHQQWQQHYHP